MAGDRHIPFEEFAADLDQIIDRIVRTREVVVVETEAHDVVTIRPGLPVESEANLPPQKTEEDYQAFLAAAGSWKDVDTDRLIADIYESRESSRPPVEM